MSGEDNASMAHSSGLGVMPSMSAECTPLKHRYDACFNKWFEDYLGLPASASSSSSASTSASKSDAEASNRDSGVSGLFSRAKSSVTPSQSPDERKRLRERLDGDCGPFWKEYQSCVLVSTKRYWPKEWTSSNTLPRLSPAAGGQVKGPRWAYRGSEDKQSFSFST